MARPKNDGKGRLGGRQKGTPNRNTSNLKNAILEIIEKKQNDVLKDFEKLSPRDRVSCFINMVKLVLPAPKTDEDTELTTNISDAVKKLFGKNE